MLSGALVAFQYVDNQVDQFRYLCWACLVIGGCTSLFYVCVIKEVKLEALAHEREHEYQELLKRSPNNDVKSELSLGDKKSSEVSACSLVEAPRDWKGWLQLPIFYINGIVYMLVRVAVNVTMTVLPFYLEEVTEFRADATRPTSVALAAVPLISYTMQILFSVFVQPRMNVHIKSRLLPMMMAILLITVSSLPLAFLNEENRNIVFVLSGIQGIGLIISLNTATSLISDVIGNDTEQSAFVYGVYSLFDKLANGFLLFYIVEHYSSDATALKWVMALTPVICAILAYMLTIMGLRHVENNESKDIDE